MPRMAPSSRNIPQCTRKDLRNAVEAAAKAGPGWARRTPYNRAQILYRLAEMLEARSGGAGRLAGPVRRPQGRRRDGDGDVAVDRLIHYAGWADKYEQLLGTVNPVASPHFNFTVTEPMGVVGVIAPDSPPLLGLLSMVAPVIASGNTVVALASEKVPYPAILLGEMLATSDLPGGVVNLLTGFRRELVPTFATHAHIRAIYAAAEGGGPQGPAPRRGGEREARAVCGRGGRLVRGLRAGPGGDPRLRGAQDDLAPDRVLGGVSPHSSGRRDRSSKGCRRGAARSYYSVMEVSADISLPAADSAQRERAKKRLYVLLQAGGWGTMLAVDVWTAVEFPEHDTVWNLSTEISVGVMTLASGLLLTHFLRPIMARWKWKQLGQRSLIPRLIAMAVAGSTVWYVLDSLWIHGVVGLPWNTKMSIPAALALEIFYASILLFGWLCLYYFYHLFERLNRSEIERFQLMTSVKEAELRALKSQVNPHFIFNSLNSLRALIDEDPARARQAVTQLANLLRYSLQSGLLETVPFEDELDVVNDYLALEQVRHEERLRLRLDIAPDALQLPIPPMLLQTLVENAVKYGISPEARGRRDRDRRPKLGWRAQDPGLQPRRDRDTDGASSSTGVGLHNAAERLRLIFGERATLRLRQDQPEQVVAEAVIPLPSHP